MAGTLVPTFTFGPTGFVAPTGPAVLAGVQGDINAAFQNTLNYQLTTPQGQLAQSQAASLSNTYATFQYYTQQVDPAYATGRMQDAIGRINLMPPRKPSIPSTLQISCVGGQITIPVGSLLEDTGGNLWASTVAITIPVAGSVIGTFACTVPGPTPVPQGKLKIYQGVNGWDTATVSSGFIGQDVEGRAAFETRRIDSVAGNSVGAIGAIVGAVAGLPGIQDYFGYNNNTAAPATVFGVTVPANAIYISVALGTATIDQVAAAILSKKGGGGPMAGNTTVTAFDENPLYAAPIPYQISFTVSNPLALIWSVVLVNNPLIPTDGQTQIENALIAAATGQSSVVPPPPKCRIASTIYAINYIPALAALGSWAQIASITIGSTNAPGAIADGSIASTTFTVSNLVSGALAIGQQLFDQAGRIINGTTLIAGAGTSWTVNNPQNIGAVFTGTGSGTNLTVSAVTGFIAPGDVVSGSGVPGGTTIVSGPVGGGAGVYVTSAATTSSGAALTTNAVITAVSAAAGSVSVNADQEPQVSAPNILVSLS